MSEFDVTYMDMKFWSYAKHKKITVDKIVKMIKYWFQFIVLIVTKRPRYVLFNMSFDKMPFLKDYLFCLTGKALGCRIVLHDMGQYLPELMEISSSGGKKLVRHLLGFTDAIIVMGNKVKQSYQPFFDGKCIEVVPGSVEDTSAMVIESARPSAQVNVLYFSYLSVSKGVWTALKAIPLVLKQEASIRFTFGGPFESEALEKEIKNYIAVHHLDQQVNFLGYVGDEVKRTALFRQADIFIFPSHRDVFGLVVLHAMAEGVAVIASLEGAVPETVLHDKTGLLFPKTKEEELAHHIILLARDKKLRDQMGKAGRQRYVDCYSPSSYGRHMIKAFHAIHERSHHGQ